MVRLVPRVGSAEERFRELRAARPHIPVPDEIMSFMWPRTVLAFARSGALERISQRFRRLGFPETEKQVRRAFQALVREERQELVRALRRDGYESLWERRPS
ncbi:MAG: hypothetical protein HY689_13310 [Chloroflexi bacterium]|nr:hypothetical protein [Chloroflexota bacterium]